LNDFNFVLGFDRHLFALRTAADRIRILDNFDIFKDPAYAKINHNIISTSTLTSNALAAGGKKLFILILNKYNSLIFLGFGPVVKDGYGIGYNIQDQFLGCVVSNYKNETNGKDFVECLRKSYDDLTNVIKAK
jgi:carnitine O-palmitoyltransferase 2